MIAEDLFYLIYTNMNDYQDTPTIIGSRGGNRGTTNAAAIKAAKRSGETKVNFYNALDLNNQKNLFLPSIFQFERTVHNLNHPIIHTFEI